MAWQPTTGLQLSGHRFERRRIECALLGRDLRTVNESVRAPAQSMTAGLVLAIIGLAACLAFALLRPQPGTPTAPMLMERQSGALFVRLGDTLHPVPNLASARLVLNESADPQPVGAAAIARAKLGPLLGIPGAPPYLGTPLQENESGWTVCDGHNDTTVIVGGSTLSDVVRPDQTLFVTPSSGGSTYLLFAGRRAVVDLRDAGLVRALGFDGQLPRQVSPLLLNLIPESPPISAPTIPGSGQRGPDALPGFPIGSVLRVNRVGGDEYYVVLREGVQRVGRFGADLIRSADSRGTRTAIAVAPDVVRAAKSVTTLPVNDFPDRAQPLTVADPATVCARWSAGAVSFSVGRQPIPDGQAPVRLVQADGSGPAVDAVYVPPGRTAYVRATSVSGSNPRAGTRFLVSGTGVRFAVHDDDAARDLGLPDAVIAAPWTVLQALPAGPELSRANASLVQDVLSSQPSAPGAGRQHRRQ